VQPKIVHEFFIGFIKIHILHHADEQQIYGVWLIEELKRHGYEISPGTLYPILHALEKEKYLESHREVVNGKIRRYYCTTKEGREVLEEAKQKIQELIKEVIP